MGKKAQRKKIEKTNAGGMPQQNTPAKTAVNNISPQKKLGKGWIRIILVTVVVILYGNTVNYDFTVDDNVFYGKHSSVQKGLSGIGETFTYGSLEKYNGMTGVQPYRPVTLSSFAVQKELFNNDPGKAHFINVLLYALLVLVLFNATPTKRLILPLSL